MVMQALRPEPRVERSDAAPEQSLVVASLLSLSGGFLDAFTWLALGGVFASSQTGNVVFLGIYAVSGQWQQAARHVLPILAFVAGAAVAVRIRAPPLCLAGEAICLAVVMLLLHRVPEPVAIIGLSFAGALQSASFRQVERRKYLSVTMTGNMLSAVEQFVATSDRDAVHGGKVMLTLCMMFLLGAAAGGWVTTRLHAGSLALPIALSICALWLCCRPSHPCRPS
ncbi:YoaK family protein [Bradyrhizobium sp. HKCCYLS1011]|uniref:YoaK family protein n=1 Tax=Bradyrhizobium sp. HKCCYLS1011 TaxID=3420733 RepID=UPI003EBA7A49